MQTSDCYSESTRRVQPDLTKRVSELPSQKHYSDSPRGARRWQQQHPAGTAATTNFFLSLPPAAQFGKLGQWVIQGERQGKISELSSKRRYEGENKSTGAKSGRAAGAGIQLPVQQHPMLIPPPFNEINGSCLLESVYKVFA